MNNLAILLRCLQLYSHNAHNLAKGSTFFSDHDFLGELYASAESDYDSVIERMLGLGETPNLVDVQTKAVNLLKSCPECSNNQACFSMILQMHKHLCAEIANISKSASIGTQQLIGDIANKSEMVQYKLKRRLEQS
jgi:DNA-binding ferritin-like protein